MTDADVLLETTYCSLRLLLLVRLYTAIYLQGDLFDTEIVRKGGLRLEVQQRTAHWFRSPTLQLCSTSDKVIYRCPIALFLAAQTPITAGEIAQSIAVSLGVPPLEAAERSGMDQILSGVLTLVQPDGWLEFVVGDPSLILWIQHGCQVTWETLPARLEPDWQHQITVWHCQYVYARCCSLILQLSASVPLPSHWGQLDSGLSPLVAAGGHLADEPLLRQLLTVADALEDGTLPPRPQGYLQLAAQLSQAFEQFYRGYQPAQVDPQAPIRLGLVILTRQLLGALLAGLGTVAPEGL
jgi:hypothetical protein